MNIPKPELRIQFLLAVNRESNPPIMVRFCMCFPTIHLSILSPRPALSKKGDVKTPSSCVKVLSVEAFGRRYVSLHVRPRVIAHVRVVVVFASTRSRGLMELILISIEPHRLIAFKVAAPPSTQSDGWENYSLPRV